ncbi:histone-like nucleoid-structuring protein Lsr2 [Nakamurella endophytica]|uniref:Lsr2 family protein n=1 Tax=Nakamurella endophytica TaxID=1748367 RepID=A0A917WM63_9ACTN|nr:Lsr2 family protein [Nakamurella endophytica]GGM15744.1 Lsr2 family protein [Nakamurella endophytica]
MASQVDVKVVDDIDGSKAAETVRFGLDGRDYEIDLSARNAKALRKVMAEFVDAGRKIRPDRTTRRAAARPSRSTGDSAAVRAWAADNGIEISERGRISRQVLEQYAAATNPAGTPAASTSEPEFAG